MERVPSFRILIATIKDDHSTADDSAVADKAQPRLHFLRRLGWANLPQKAACQISWMHYRKRPDKTTWQPGSASAPKLITKTCCENSAKVASSCCHLNISAAPSEESRERHEALQTLDTSWLSSSQQPGASEWSTCTWIDWKIDSSQTLWPCWTDYLLSSGAYWYLHKS